MRIESKGQVDVALMVEAFVGTLGERCLQLFEKRDVVLQVGDEEVCEVSRHPVSDDDAERGEVLAVLGEGICRDKPPVLAQTL